jgi:hypothetical protein
VFYSSLALSVSKAKQKRSKLSETIGKNERNIRFFMLESKKQIGFDHKKTKH